MQTTTILTRKRPREDESDSDASDDASDDGAVLCEVCRAAPRKYCCPRCGALTCSLACCSAHKRATGCDGRRDVSAYKSARSMGLRDLRADCAFLEAGRGAGTRMRFDAARECFDGRSYFDTLREAASTRVEAASTVRATST